MKSLRGQLVAFWILLLTFCIALGGVMVVLFRSSAGVLIAEAQTSTEQSCQAIARRYAKSLADPHSATPQIDLLHVLLQLVLLEAPHVEGGVWSGERGFLAYAYPTYEGSSVKRDIPEAEQGHIAQMAQDAARTQQAQTDTVRGTREALVVTACPLEAPQKNLVAWTMTRASANTLAAQGSLRFGLGVLLFGIVASGGWLGAILLRGYRHVQRLEATLAGEEAGGGAAEPLAPTGLVELDRLVAGVNRSRLGYRQAQAKLQDAERQHARDQRLTALGRMTAGIAHEIRNPIAAMRLKAENALAGPPARQPAALEVILGQIARLDGLVQNLLAVVQPLALQRRSIDLPAWLAERVAALAPRAALKGIEVKVDAEPLPVEVDPQHLGRAVDNLLENAIRHAPTGGHVRLSAFKPAPGRWRLRVDDDGPGVAETVRSQLFEPFATGRPDGTGLGLALAREVAIAHGGDLRYEPLAPNGSRFEMELACPAC